MMILVFLLCGGCGAVFLLELCCRRRQITQMLDIIRYLRRDICCSRAPLHHILSQESCPKELPLLQYMDFSEPFDLSASYLKAKAHSESEMFFSEEEWEASDALFSVLGLGDVTEQERCLSQAEGRFESSEKMAKELIGSKGKPALVLGCSAGVVLVLMLL